MDEPAGKGNENDKLGTGFISIQGIRGIRTINWVWFHF